MKKKTIKADLCSDIHFDIPTPPLEEIRAMAEATALMLNDPNNEIITILPGKYGKPLIITRH